MLLVWVPVTGPQKQSRFNFTIPASFDDIKHIPLTSPSLLWPLCYFGLQDTEVANGDLKLEIKRVFSGCPKSPGHQRACWKLYLTQTLAQNSVFTLTRSLQFWHYRATVTVSDLSLAKCRCSFRQVSRANQVCHRNRRAVKVTVVTDKSVTWSQSNFGLGNVLSVHLETSQHHCQMLAENVLSEHLLSEHRKRSQRASGNDCHLGNLYETFSEVI